MKKYLVLLNQTISQFAAFRLKILVSIFWSFVTPLAILMAIKGATPNSDINYQSLISYYLIISLLSPFLRSSIDEYMSEIAASGEVNNFFLKPISFYKWHLVRDVSERIIVLGLLLPIFFLFASIITHLHSLENSTILLFILSLPVCFLLSFNLSFLVGLLSFWVDDMWAVSNIKVVSIMLLGGIIFPYSFFPSAIKNVLFYTPFPYVVSLPARIINKEVNMSEFAIAFLWIIVLTVVSQKLFKKAVRNYGFTAN